MLTPLFVLMTLVLVVATLLPLTNVRHWSVRDLDFPRLQLATGLAMLLVLHVIWLASGSVNTPSALWLLPLAVCFIYQAYWILPFSELVVPEVETAGDAAGSRLRLLTSNVLMSNRDSARLVALVREMRPDVLLVVETDAWWQARLDAALDELPHRIACPLDNRYGMHLYSRLPLVESHVDFLVTDDAPSIAARLQLDDHELRFHAIHPKPPAPGESERSAERDVELLTLAETLEHVAEPIIVTGDLNDVAWSRTTRQFRRVSGLLDPRVGRGMYNTFHADWPFLRWPLDHFFLSSHYRVVRMHRLESIGSDHFPVFIELVLAHSNEIEMSSDNENIDRDLAADTRERREAIGAGTPSIGSNDADSASRARPRSDE